MATREGIREGLRQVLSDSLMDDALLASDIIENLIFYLHKNGVVIKVDRELPKYYAGYVDYEKDGAGDYIMGKPIFYDIYNKFTENQRVALNKAGYIATESLIKEEE